MRWLAAIALIALPGLAAGQQAVVGAREDAAAGFVVGRVCVDGDGDEVCAPEEPGVPHARILLSDGTFATTDGRGRYHLAAVPTRRVELLSADAPLGVRDAYGRVLVKLDLGPLGRGASVRGGPRRVVELGPAALQQVDFPLTFAAAQAPGLAPAARPPRGELRGGVHRFHATGKAQPGHRVRVAGREAQVAEDGTFSATVPLEPGENRLVIADLAPHGELVLYEQRVAVVRREGRGVLFLPSAPRRFASVGLPDPSAAPAAVTSVPVVGPAGTEVELGGSRATLGPEGTARLELALARGPNRVPIRLAAPGLPAFADEVELVGRGLSATSALLSLELGYDRGRREWSLLGRGQATVLRALGDFDLAAGVDLDAGDVLEAVGRADDAAGERLSAQPLVLLRPRAPLASERALDPELYPPVSGDDGLAGSRNPSRSRLWAHLQHPRFGEARAGAFQADLTGVEVGRYQRSLFGGLLDARAPLGPVTLQARAFGAPPFSALGEPQPAAAHDELAGTGGSLFYLRHARVMPGSEKLRIVLRDGLTGLPLDERALERYRDYEIDYASGRILLARPLPMFAGDGPLLATALQSHRPTLVVDYEHRPLAGARAQIFGGRAGVTVGPWAELSASMAGENRLDAAEGERRYRLYGARGRGRVGPVTLAAELAQSEGSLFAETASGGFGVSDTGGLGYLVAPADPVGVARAYSVRAAASEEAWGAQLWARGREAGFSDSANASAARARQLGGLARATLGRFELKALFDDRLGADPRDPFGAGTAAARDGLLRAAGRFGDLTVAAEGTYASLELAPELGGEPQSGGRAGVGVRVDYALLPELSVHASHHQRVARFGEGAGALDDTFSAVGASWRPKDDLGVSLRGGWGPGVGTQVQVGAERSARDEIAYGVWTADVDGPNAGRAVAVAGARRRVDERSEVFVEDLFARDVDALRIGRAIGLQVAPARQLTLGARYERGVRLPFTGERALLRDAGSARASLLVGGLRLGLLGEVRHERGDALAGSDVERWQTLGGLMADARPFDALQLGARLVASKTRNRGRDEATVLEGYLAAALRLEPWVVLASYSIVDRISPAGQGEGFALEHLVSVRPSVVLFDRLRLGGGVHAAFFRGGVPSSALSVSLRPAVRVIGGLEVAAEVARRSSAPEGEALDAVRAEVAWWFDGVLGVAVGYNLYGFSGAGVARESGSGDRVYLRLEAAY